MRYGYYKYVVMLFGLTNALVAFMDLMNIVFKPYLDRFMVLFIDNIFYSRTPKEQASHLRQVLEVLRKNESYVKLSKCKFWLEKVAFFSHIVSKEGMFEALKK